MKKGVSNIVLMAMILMLVLAAIILIRHNVNEALIINNIMLSELERKFNTLNENVDVINNGSIYIESDTDCPIRYLIVYNNKNINVTPVNNSSIHINDKLFNPSYKMYVVTCNGNIVRLHLLNNLRFNDTRSNSLFPINSYLFQPGGREFLNSSICPIIFHKYNNSYGVLEVNTTFNLFCYNRSGLVYDPPVMYFYNVFLVDSGGSSSINVSLFSRGHFDIRHSTRNVVLYFFTRLYDALTGSSVVNASFPNILNLGVQKAVQEVNLINNTTLYLYAWPRYPSNNINGNFLVFLSHNLGNIRLSSTIMKVEEGFVITDKALVVAPSTLTSVNYYVRTLFYNNSSFIVRKIPLNLTINYNRTESSYFLKVCTSNGTILAKEFNETNIVLYVNKLAYEDNYVSIILEKIWLYSVLNEPVASMLLRAVSKKPLLSILAYKTKDYLEIYNDAYPLKPTIEPLVVQRYYDGKVLEKNKATHIFIQAHYITRYSGSPANTFVMKLPYLVIVTTNK